MVCPGKVKKFPSMKRNLLKKELIHLEPDTADNASRSSYPCLRRPWISLAERDLQGETDLA